MARRRIALIAALCTLALPVAAVADGAAESQHTHSRDTAEADCPICAQRAQAAAVERRAARDRRAVERSARNARLAATRDRSATMHVDTTIRRQVAPGCEYVAVAEGSYRADDLTLRDGSQPIRDVDVRGDATLTCNGEQVRRRTHRFVLPVTTPDELSALLEVRLATTVPGTPCAWASSYEFAGGDLHATAVNATNCSAERRALSVRDYGSSGSSVAGTMRGFEGAARGGGPVIRRDPDSFDARTGAH